MHDVNPDPRLRPTLECPGIQVFAPVHPDRPFAHISPAVPVAVCVCRCGAHATAHGAEAVAALVAKWTAHQPECPGRAVRPCEHCGEPTRCRSTGLSGWPAHAECYAVWADRPVEQRRRAHQIDRIKARELQRRKAARLHEQLTRQGYAPDVIQLIITGGWSSEQEPAA
ncbi:hypothetical protein [Actinacidiphila acididurans]|uniref:Uncharacterized protein n=1 Tax=Actinacidiphila acididurans TaxID=2784346 RepID=A0ABS2TR61_9ACTN|nr:hypothetical protein [Actinacidiphila acididurans]MBM9505312.1 hypothetical protein [Actinacidiphila acididurans]